MQFPGEMSQCGLILVFTPQLNEIGSAANQLVCHSFRPFGGDVTEIENGVEPGARQRIHRAQSVSRPVDGRSSKVSEFISRSTKPVS